MWCHLSRRVRRWHSDRVSAAVTVTIVSIGRKRKCSCRCGCKVVLYMVLLWGGTWCCCKVVHGAAVMWYCTWCCCKVVLYMVLRDVHGRLWAAADIAWCLRANSKRNAAELSNARRLLEKNIFPTIKRAMDIRSYERGADWGLEKGESLCRFVLCTVLCLMWSHEAGRPVPVAVRSKAYVCHRSLAGIAGSNPAGGMGVCFLWALRVVPGRSLCNEPITRPGESYRERDCVCVCVPFCVIRRGMTKKIKIDYLGLYVARTGFKNCIQTCGRKGQRKEICCSSWGLCPASVYGGQLYPASLYGGHSLSIMNYTSVL